MKQRKISEIIQLKDFHINRLQRSPGILNAGKDIVPYTQLKELLPPKHERPTDKEGFEKTFSHYYRLRMKKEVKKHFFKELYRYNSEGLPDEPYGDLLMYLYRLPKIGGKLQFSFVSKLVAFLDEDMPIWDINVRTFLGIAVEANGCENSRTEGFVALMNLLYRTYTEWLENENIKKCIQQAKRKHQKLNSIEDIRILDWLIWASGGKLLNNQRERKSAKTNV